MQSLIYPYVGTRAKPRLWPSSLDVAATLGSSRATALLTGPLGQSAYANYAAALAAQQRAFARTPAATWQSNLYCRCRPGSRATSRGDDHRTGTESRHATHATRDQRCAAGRGQPAL